MSYTLETFSFADVMACRNQLRQLFGSDVRNVVDAAERTVDFFYREFVDLEGRPAYGLVRFFKTHLFGELSPELQECARELEPAADSMADSLRCLTLLATRGIEPEWNSSQNSRHHRVIPLTSVEVVERAPMIAQLITQMGLDIANVVRPPRALLLEKDGAYNVFHVPVAEGSPYILAQEEFVKPYGIRSVLGFGGLLSTGDMFAVVLFSRVQVPEEIAANFRIVGLNLKLAILPLVRAPLPVLRTRSGPWSRPE